MVAKSRFIAVGTSGRTGVASDPSSSNRGDYFRQTITFTPTVVASAAEQTVNFTFPTGAQILHATINVFTPEVTGLTKTISVGVVGMGSAIISGRSVAVAGIVTGGALGTPVQSGNQLTYTLGSADFVELDCEIIIDYLGSEV